MKHIKMISLALVLSSLLLSGCGRSKYEPTRPEFKSSKANSQTNYTTPVTVGSKNILVEIANTDKAREQGLSGREKLEDDTGMLFEFANIENSKPNFWMKDMNFDIDIIWINNKKIVAIEKSVPAPKNNSNLPIFSPPSDITHVLEVPSGWSEENKINIGDAVTL